MTDLLAACPDHAGALIRHSWREVALERDGNAVGPGWTYDHRCECAVCNRELAGPVGATRPWRYANKPAQVSIYPDHDCRKTLICDGGACECVVCGRRVGV